MGDINPRLSPTRITSLDGLNVVHISAGDEHSVVMAGETFFNRQVYSWGLGKNGRLGHNDELNRLKPTRVNFFRGRKVITVVAGGAHNLATSEMPQGVCVWSWGAGSYGQLGHRDTWDALIPGSVDEIRHETIRFIDAGQRHSLAISASKQLWLWGQGIHGDYDVPDPDASSTSILYPVKIDLPELSLISARAGRGRTFIWGDRAIEREKPRPFGGTAAQSMCRSLPEYESLTSDSFRIVYRVTIYNGGHAEQTLRLFRQFEELCIRRRRVMMNSAKFSRSRLSELEICFVDAEAGAEDLKRTSL
ncbi:Ultraviolet-B receptor UVR8 [Phytophthora ramorum]|uniref:Ultraviolet-B receptor UVR8 n=1 Tax=Phytophthora ramorum TaxID=164328 RepID=UPI0030B5C26E|nr:Ultraviolet-B receptor UVR8 [Phytophthora ramorum]